MKSYSIVRNGTVIGYTGSTVTKKAALVAARDACGDDVTLGRSRDQLVSAGARAMGLKGGRASSQKKTAAVRLNAKKGGRARRICTVCGQPVTRSYHVDPALDAICPGRTAVWQKPSERKDR